MVSEASRFSQATRQQVASHEFKKLRNEATKWMFDLRRRCYPSHENLMNKNFSAGTFQAWTKLRTTRIFFNLNVSKQPIQHCLTSSNYPVTTRDTNILEVSTMNTLW